MRGTNGGLTALVWKDRQEVYMLTNMDSPPAEGNFYNSNQPHGMVQLAHGLCQQFSSYG